MNAAISWAQEDNGVVMAIKKNRKVPLQGLNKQKYATLSGSDVINMETG